MYVFVVFVFKRINGFVLPTYVVSGVTFLGTYVLEGLCVRVLGSIEMPLVRERRGGSYSDVLEDDFVIKARANDNPLNIGLFVVILKVFAVFLQIIL